MSLFWDKQLKRNQQSCPVYAVKGGLCPAALSASSTFIILPAAGAVHIYDSYLAGRSIRSILKNEKYCGERGTLYRRCVWVRKAGGSLYGAAPAGSTTARNTATTPPRSGRNPCKPPSSPLSTPL